MRTVFVDVDTQLDFLFPAGALYVPAAQRIVPLVAALNRHAAERGIPVVSTTDAHSENDPEFVSWPPHCVAGAIGQHKPDATLIEKRVVVPNRDVALSIEGVRQIVIEKQTVDGFAAPNLSRVLDCLAADGYVVYGVVTEICVLYAVRGLLKTGKPVTVVTDAIETLNAADSRRALREIVDGGGMLATAGEILAMR